jgi:UDPglucose 6-dehydrogenase
MHILIIGSGYVGLVSGACFAEKGHHVLCLDIDEKKIGLLQEGVLPFYEPGLETLVKKNIEAKRLFFTSCYKKGVQGADIAFICTPTPSNKDGSANISFVQSCLESLAFALDHPMVIAIKSTVPPGTGSKMEQLMKHTLEAHQKTIPVSFVANPEFLREGSAVDDCLNPDRIIIGTENALSKDMLKDVYRPFSIEPQRLIFMDRCSAEMTKYAANAMLATRISFMNELSRICDTVGANIDSIRLGIGLDKRIGPEFLQAGIGYGGSCFPKDLRALQALAENAHIQTPLLNAVETINETQKKLLADKICCYFLKEGGIKNKTIAVWGLSFKPNTDDIREAPALSLIKELLDHGANLKLYDPVAMPHAQRHFESDQRINFCASAYEACQDAEALALVTEWQLFRDIDLDKTLALMKGRAFFDGRNQYNLNTMHEKGFDYFGVGIPAKKL